MKKNSKGLFFGKVSDKYKYNHLDNSFNKPQIIILVLLMPIFLITIGIVLKKTLIIFCVEVFLILFLSINFLLRFSLICYSYFLTKNDLYTTKKLDNTNNKDLKIYSILLPILSEEKNVCKTVIISMIIVI